jgi:hypothetical protein
MIDVIKKIKGVYMANKFLYYFLIIAITMGLILVPIVFSYQHLLKQTLANISLSIKGIQYTIALTFTLIAIFFIKSK